MTELASGHQKELSSLMQQLLPGHSVPDWTDQTPLLGEIPEFDSMMLANLLGGIESRFGLELDDANLSIESFETWGSLKVFLQKQISQ